MMNDINPLQSEINRLRKQILKPNEKITGSQWAEEYRHVSSMSSALAGRWRNSNNPALIEPMDTITNNRVRTVVCCVASQWGKTELLLNATGYYMHVEPCPILIGQPTDKMAHAFARTRLDEMIRVTPVLKEIMSRDHKGKTRTVLEKTFMGGSVSIIGANSPADSASRPIRFVAMDEISKYPPSAKDEGAPHLLMMGRSISFYNSKHLMISTPVHPESIIWLEYQKTDQRELLIPCHDCDKFQIMDFQHVYWPGKGIRRTADPSKAVYHCPECGTQWTDTQRRANILRCKWEPQSVSEDPEVVGFHANSLTSRFTKLSDITQKHLKARRDGVNAMKVFVNMIEAKPYDEIVFNEQMWTNLAQRREPYDIDSIPGRVMFLTSAVDVQMDRLEWLVCGWANEFEGFVFPVKVLMGNPTRPQVWEHLKEEIAKPFNISNRTVRISATCIDTGYATQQVYSFCARNRFLNIFAIKGKPGSEPIFNNRFTKPSNNIQVQLYRVGIDTAKDHIYNALTIDEPGPNYFHFSQGCDDEFLQQVYAEQKATKIVRNRKVTGYFQVRQRNEAIDLITYNLAAAFSFGPSIDWDRMKHKTDSLKKEPQVTLELDTQDIEKQAKKVDNKKISIVKQLMRKKQQRGRSIL